MWKLLIAFIVFAAVALFVLKKSGGNIDMGGEKHDVSTPDHAATPASAAAPALAPAVELTPACATARPPCRSWRSASRRISGKLTFTSTAMPR